MYFLNKIKSSDYNVKSLNGTKKTIENNFSVESSTEFTQSLPNIIDIQQRSAIDQQFFPKILFQQQ